VKRINHRRRFSQQGYDHFLEPKRSRSEVSNFRGFEVAKSIFYAHPSVDDMIIIMVIQRIILTMLVGSISHRTMIVMSYQMTCNLTPFPSASYILLVIKVIHKTMRVIYPNCAYRLDSQLGKGRTRTWAWVEQGGQVSF
jgi:hypothetical protein